MADFGEHHFVYSLYPHLGGWDEKVQAEAYALNDPIIVWKVEGPRSTDTVARHASLITQPSSLVTCSAPNVVIETVKRAEDGEGIIVRLYESHRKRGAATVRFAFAVESAWETNLLEGNLAELPVASGAVSLNLKPYQIVTLRVT